MEALQKLKTLAFQCAAAGGSPSKSAAHAPCFSFRRRKTLRGFLKRSDLSRTNQAAAAEMVEKKGLIVSRSLKDLFVSSPPLPPPNAAPAASGGVWRRFALDGLGGQGLGGGRRFGTASLRCRLLRRAWRPVLVAIPESRTEEGELLL